MTSPRVSYTLTEIQDRSPGLLHPHRNSGSLLGSLTPTHKFRIAPRVSYTHTEIQDHSPGLLHPHRNSGSLPRSLNRNSGSLPGSLTPTQKFGISPRVSYTLTEIQDFSSGLLHPHRNSRSLPESLTPTQNLGSLPRSLTLSQDLSDTTAGLLHPNSRLLTLGDYQPLSRFAQHTLITLHSLFRTLCLHWT